MRNCENLLPAGQKVSVVIRYSLFVLRFFYIRSVRQGREWGCIQLAIGPADWLPSLFVIRYSLFVFRSCPFYVPLVLIKSNHQNKGGQINEYLGTDRILCMYGNFCSLRTLARRATGKKGTAASTQTRSPNGTRTLSNLFQSGLILSPAIRRF